MIHTDDSKLLNLQDFLIYNPANIRYIQLVCFESIIIRKHLSIESFDWLVRALKMLIPSQIFVV